MRLESGSAGPLWEGVGRWPWMLHLPVRGFHVTCECSLCLLTAGDIYEVLFRSTCEAGSTGAGPGGFVEVYMMEGTLFFFLIFFFLFFFISTF